MADKLTDCDIGQAWSILRGQIASHLLDDQLIPVPYITEADLYDLTAVFCKQEAKKGLLAKLTKPRVYELLGPLSSVADLGQCNRAELEMMSRSRIEEISYPPQIKLDLYGKSDREIHLTLSRPHKRLILLTATQPGDIVINREADPALDYVDRVYLITEVVYVNGVDMVVMCKGRTKQYSSNREMPLAFNYMKFPLDEEGTVGTQVATGGDMKKMQFLQLRAHRRPDDPLPEAPRTSISARWRPAAKRNPRDGLPLLPAAGSNRGPLPPLPPPDPF